jgi:glycosyltransferase involved in cell wall biosynthesis
MRIVHLTASSFFGGPERQMLGLASALPPEYESSFLSFSEGGRCRVFLAEARNAGFDAAKLANDFPRIRACIREVAAQLHECSADVLVTHGYKSNLFGRPAARKAGVPIVSVSRGWTGENLKIRCYEALDRFHLRFMDRVVCVSSGQAERVRKSGVTEAKMRIIRNGARLGAFETPDPAGKGRLRVLAGGDGPIVLAAGRLSAEKGFRVLVEAARLLANVRFVICGEGAERASLEQQIDALALQGHVRLAGFRDDLDSLIPFADLVVLPSFTEGLPNVALEAGAAGIPVVATAVGGTPEVVRDGVTGFLVPPGDPRALSQRVIDLLQHPERAREFGTAARQWMQEKFTFEAQARSYCELFDEITRTRKVEAELACS